jgi:hypothetical protein
LELAEAMPLCTWQHVGRCTAEPDDSLESCLSCGAAFHNMCAVNGVFALFEGQKELENAPDKCCGRCGEWQQGGAQAAVVERMHVVEDAEPLLCVIDELEVVRSGKYRSQDCVLCLVPGCALAKGGGLLRDSVPDHFAASKLASTHGMYTVVKTRRGGAGPSKRPRLAKPSPSELAARRSGFFLSPAEKHAVAQAPPEPSAVAEAAAAIVEADAPAVPQAAAATTEEAGAPAVPLPADAASTLPSGGASMLLSLQRGLLALVSEVRSLPSRIVEANEAAAEKTKEQAAADRIKGHTLQEVRESTGLVLQEGFLVCVQCVQHCTISCTAAW